MRKVSTNTTISINDLDNTWYVGYIAYDGFKQHCLWSERVRYVKVEDTCGHKSFISLESFLKQLPQSEIYATQSFGEFKDWLLS